MSNPGYDFIATIVASNQQVNMTKPLIDAQCETEKQRAKTEQANRRLGYLKALGLEKDLTDPAKRDGVITALKGLVTFVEE